MTLLDFKCGKGFFHAIPAWRVQDMARMSRSGQEWVSGFLLNTTHKKNF